MTTEDLLHRRHEALAPSYRLFYDDPVHLVRGEGVHLWDSDGRQYLDCYNNVPSVGHCHPHVVSAIAEQAGTLNTHTRYLHDGVVTLAERLGSRLGGDLGSAWLQCSGTEANDLAIQVARAASGNNGVIVTEHAYHGNSTLVRALSSNRHSGSERPDWIQVVDPPNTYRGQHRSDDAATRYADQVAEAARVLSRHGHGVAAILIDCSWDAPGVLTAPDGYVAQAADHVWEAGGLVIADEVQAGYCRLGTNFWGHERYGLLPDIVTMGKPMGAGHPVAATVTTPAIAAAFADQRSYFNTFGGNPVSAAAANAVLDVIEQEDLLANVTNTGEVLRAGLESLAHDHELIGNVSGAGLFWGIDLVTDRDSRQPLSPELTQGFITALRNNGVLMGAAGVHGNVVKMRPPLPFSKDNATHALETLAIVLSDFAAHVG
ncbi:MAG: aminotransferase class III-fold pyridoxal phosphate-dependent enzyme [Acidimicrobiales bacterium]|nr:aminotransferase class III-fold pyridoxal phosphate-dependent enzyme [Acidimicrobiales bacterium]RZV43345.1 MAG: aminotransferase class III-fold pyridoxal phosphate-dependent enzyme [Acidimicrobiales bacterium]